MSQLEDIRQFANSLVAYTEKEFGVSVLAVPFTEMRRQGFVMFFGGQVVFEVGFLSTSNPQVMFELTRIEAEEAIKAFFQNERGLAA